MSETYVKRAGLKVAPLLAEFVEQHALPGTEIGAEIFWQGLEALFERFGPPGERLLAKRNQLQSQIDAWHDANPGPVADMAAYRAFLHAIGYLLPEPAAFSISTDNVDAEIATVAAPQLVVPCLNERFALNAANARWGSLYDALYGTDALAPPLKEDNYNADRGAAVIAAAKRFLDEAAPLKTGEWADWCGGDLALGDPDQLVARTERGLLLRNHGLHIEVHIGRDGRIGRHDPAGIQDIILESAATTIVDLEDSVAAVDADDKVHAYWNWLGLMRGELEAAFEKDGQRLVRRLNADRTWNSYVLPGRSLLLVRNVGLHMTTPAVLLDNDAQAPEGILDAAITALCALHDIRKLGCLQNSKSGSIYIVKPKLHGPEEVTLTNDLMDAVEDLLGVPRHTIKLGIMDEERRTSANLAACIFAVRHRLAFINTGFLDRTGDEIHTCMRAGPVMRKADIKGSPWIAAYEARNVSVGLACGLPGRAQIGKGMWAAPDNMADMIAQKVSHPQAGASTAWVPSPTAATLHAIHYHQISVAKRQRELAGVSIPGIEELLRIPVQSAHWSSEQIAEELRNNVQSILGYVVRWIDQGVGCSKVPDVHDVGLMEDRATLRISSQHIANWLAHGVVSIEQVETTLADMALKVDQQNADDPLYTPMAGRLEKNLALQAARALIFEGAAQPNGYTEPILHAFRRRAKARHA